MTTSKTRYMRELRIMMADILIKKPQKTKRGTCSYRHTCDRKFMSFTEFERINKKPTLIQEYNIVDTLKDRTLGIAIKVKNVKRFSEKIEKRGWKVLNVTTSKNCGSGTELPLSIFTIRK